MALKNGQDAIALKYARYSPPFFLTIWLTSLPISKQFASIKAGDACTAGQDACAGTQFAQCVGGKYVVQPCAATTVCAALPLVNSAGTSVTCTTPADRDARLAAVRARATMTDPCLTRPFLDWCVHDCCSGQGRPSESRQDHRSESRENCESISCEGISCEGFTGASRCASLFQF